MLFRSTAAAPRIPVVMGVRVGPVVLVGGCLVMGGPAGPAGPPQSRLPLVGWVVMVAMPGCSGLVGTAAGADAEWMLDSVRSGRGGRELIPVLRDTGLAMLVWALAVAGALAFGQLS